MDALLWIVAGLVAWVAFLFAVEYGVPLVAYIVTRPLVGVVWLVRAGWSRATHRRPA